MYINIIISRTYGIAQHLTSNILLTIDVVSIEQHRTTIIMIDIDANKEHLLSLQYSLSKKDEKGLGFPFDTLALIMVGLLSLNICWH